MAEPRDPHDIARRTFEVARRGYEQQDVRGFLHEVSSLVERLQRSERELKERAERAESRLATATTPDEAAMMEVLGEETTRVLTSAREAATEIRSKAEASAERMIADATAEAAETRGAATRAADERLAEAAAESEKILAAARTELERRSAEAEEVAARICEGGAAQAEALREEGQRELDRAAEEAEASLDAARSQGRVMVAEAQAVRERVLRDLAARRKKARVQVEKLNAGRERLLEAYEVVRRTIDEATAELTVSLSEARTAADAAARRLEAEAEPTLEQLDEEVANAGLVDLPIAELGADEVEDGVHDDTPGPFSGEVPAVEAAEALDLSTVEAEPAAAPAGASAPAGLDERRGRRSRRRKGGFEGLPPAELTRLEPPNDDEGVRVLAEPATEPSAATNGSSAPSEEPGATLDEPLTEPPADEPGDPTAGDEASAADVEPAEDAAGEAADDVDDLFARLREAGTPADRVAGEKSDGDADADAEVAVEAAVEVEADADAEAEVAIEVEAEVEVEEPSAASEPEPEATGEAAGPFVARDEALVPIDKDLSRRLKRALADEQNEVLDLLRRAKPKGVDDLLPALADHVARWAATAGEALGSAATAGASSEGGAAGPVGLLADELAQGLVGPLRERIDRTFVASDGNLDDVADRVRALYREWKGQRLTETSQHYVVAAYARGAFDAIAAGSEVRWVVDPSRPPCPDCDDNVLAGGVAKGDEFPTGSACAPAHPGCRCLVLPV